MLKAGVCNTLLNALKKGAKEGDKTAQLQPHLPEGLASTVCMTQQDIDMTAEAFTKKMVKNNTTGVLNKPQWLQTMVQLTYEGDLDLIIEEVNRQMGQMMPECQAQSADLRVDTGLRNQDPSALTLRILTGLRTYTLAHTEHSDSRILARSLCAYRQACSHTRSHTWNVLIPARLNAWSNKAFLLTLFPL